MPGPNSPAVGYNDPVKPSGISELGSKKFKLELFPPEIIFKMWALGLDAGVSDVTIMRSSGTGPGVKYSYGGAISLILDMPQTHLELGFDPGKTEGTFAYQANAFRLGAKGSPSGGGFTIGYGLTPLPALPELEGSMHQGWNAIKNGYGDLSRASSIRDITAMIPAGKTIADAYGNLDKIGKAASNTDSYGVMLEFNYSQKGEGPPRAGAAAVPQGLSATIWLGGSF